MRSLAASAVNAPDIMVKNAVSYLIVTDQGRDLLARGAAVWPMSDCYMEDQ